MPYLLGAIAVLFALAFVVRLVKEGARKADGGASPLYVAGLFAGLGVAGLLAMMGRLPAALFVLMIVAGFSWVDRMARRIRPRPDPGPLPPGPHVMTRAEAFDILGLREGASVPDIQEAYTCLMSKIHPDLDGSAWLAARLDQARETLLGS